MLKFSLICLLLSWSLRPYSQLFAEEPQFLWDTIKPLPKVAELPLLEGVRFSVIKRYEPESDGYRFLHGVALCMHHGKLYASFGHNRGNENTDTEESRWCSSQDLGHTWSPVSTIDSGSEPSIGVSHGAFLSHANSLWAFQGAYRGFLGDVHTRAYVLNEETGQWQPRGMVIDSGFWPMQEPQPMDDGNWIMAGLKVGEGNPAAVAVSHGADFTRWDVRVIPAATRLEMWGESTVIVHGRSVTTIARYGAQPKALFSGSDDFGHTWSDISVSNLPLVTSKPYAGTLSTGQRYLIGTTAADAGKRRAPLTIAVSRPDEASFSKVFVIRPALFPAGPGESHINCNLAYPYAVEYQGHLYVGYSNNGGNQGRRGTGRETVNNNSAELAVIPVDQLRVD